MRFALPSLLLVSTLSAGWIALAEDDCCEAERCASASSEDECPCPPECDDDCFCCAPAPAHEAPRISLVPAASERVRYLSSAERSPASLPPDAREPVPRGRG